MNAAIARKAPKETAKQRNLINLISTIVVNAGFFSRRDYEYSAESNWTKLQVHGNLAASLGVDANGSGRPLLTNRSMLIPARAARRLNWNASACGSVCIRKVT